MVLKLRKKRKLLRYLKSSIRKTKINKINLNPLYKFYINKNNLKSSNNDNLDKTNNLLYDLFLQNKSKFNNLKKIVLNNIQYKKVSGIRLQIGGRLTRRYTASRSISKLRYKGSLVNINSSLKGSSSALLRGSFRPNLEFTKLNSKTRIGSFGVKGWVSGV